jgi:hypothetical protein
MQVQRGPKDLQVTKLSLLFYLLFLSNSLIAQELHMGPLMTLGERYYNATIIDLDSIVIFEDNQYKGMNLHPPAIRLEYPLSKNFHLGLGIQYRRTSFNMGVYKKTSHPLGPAKKGSIVSLPTLEIPLTAFYNLTPARKTNVRVFGGIMGAINGIRFDPSIYKGDPQSEDYPLSVAEALRRADSVPRRAYLSNFFGLNITYWRIGLDIYQTATLSRSMNSPLEIWGGEYAFNRKSRSLRLALTYKLWERNNKNNKQQVTTE